MKARKNLFRDHAVALDAKTRIGFIGTLIVTMSLVGCLPTSKSPDTSSTAPATGATTQTPSTSQTPSSTSTTTSLTDIGASALIVTSAAGTQQSFADVAASNAANYTLFEFVGVTCEQCKTEGPYITNVLAKYGTSVSRFDVFPNQLSEYQASDYIGFSAANTASAPYVVDGTLNVLKTVRANSSQYFGIYVIVSKSTGKGLILNATNAYQSVDGALAAITSTKQ